MQAFLSYQTLDKKIAGRVARILGDIGIKTFLAHEDIEVSHEWQVQILEEIGRCDLFVAILSANYLSSPYCMQESGIAVFRRAGIIPLSIDGTVPPGFMGYIQSKKIDPKDIDRGLLLKGIGRHSPKFMIDLLIRDVANSGSFRGAEANFQAILPYLGKATDEQIVRLLKVSAENGQVWDAAQCKSEYLPPLFKSHGRRLDKATRSKLKEVLARWL